MAYKKLLLHILINLYTNFAILRLMYIFVAIADNKNYNVRSM